MSDCQNEIDYYFAQTKGLYLNHTSFLVDRHVLASHERDEHHHDGVDRDRIRYGDHAPAHPVLRVAGTLRQLEHPHAEPDEHQADHRSIEHSLGSALQRLLHCGIIVLGLLEIQVGTTSALNRSVCYLKIPIYRFAMVANLANCYHNLLDFTKLLLNFAGFVLEFDEMLAE